MDTLFSSELPIIFSQVYHAQTRSRSPPPTLPTPESEPSPPPRTQFHRDLLLAGMPVDWHQVLRELVTREARAGREGKRGLAGILSLSFGSFYFFRSWFFVFFCFLVVFDSSADGPKVVSEKGEEGGGSGGGERGRERGPSPDRVGFSLFMWSSAFFPLFFFWPGNLF